TRLEPARILEPGPATLEERPIRPLGVVGLTTPEAEEPAEEASRRSIDEVLAIRLGLQRRAASNVRRHLRRAARRLGVLLLADTTAVLLVDLLVQSARRSGAGIVDTLFPNGLIATPQYLVALFVGLYVTGNYSAGDFRRSPRRLFLGVLVAALLQIWAVVWMSGFVTPVLQFMYTGLVVFTALLAERLFVD